MAIARELTVAEVEALEAALSFAARIARVERPLSLEQVQDLYDGFLEEEIDDADAIMALGLSFGQCLISSGPFEWVRVTDEYGEETSVSVAGATIYIHPISMIQKRLADGEKVIVEQLCNDSLSHLGALVDKGNYSTR
jgi:Domain of unknown function (DUF3806)